MSHGLSLQRFHITSPTFFLIWSCFSFISSIFLFCPEVCVCSCACSCVCGFSIHCLIKAWMLRRQSYSAIWVKVPPFFLAGPAWQDGRAHLCVCRHKMRGSSQRENKTSTELQEYQWMRGESIHSMSENRIFFLPKWCCLEVCLFFLKKNLWICGLVKKLCSASLSGFIIHVNWLEPRTELWADTKSDPLNSGYGYSSGTCSGS